MPYTIALKIPLDLVLLALVKYETVIGIIGNTHGVSNAAKPLKKEIKNKSQKFLLFFEAELPILLTDSSDKELLSKLCDLSSLNLRSNSIISGGKHCFSSHVIKYISPLTENGDFSLTISIC